jgi:hypothetical protein
VLLVALPRECFVKHRFDRFKKRMQVFACKLKTLPKVRLSLQEEQDKTLPWKIQIHHPTSQVYSAEEAVLLGNMYRKLAHPKKTRRGNTMGKKASGMATPRLDVSVESHTMMKRISFGSNARAVNLGTMCSEAVSVLTEKRQTELKTGNVGVAKKHDLIEVAKSITRSLLLQTSSPLQYTADKDFPFPLSPFSNRESTSSIKGIRFGKCL